MKKEIIVPKAGLTMTHATIDSWHVAEGDQVKKDQAILDLMTEKITVEVNSPDDGFIVSIQKREGETVTVGEVLAVFETDQKKADSDHSSITNKRPTQEMTKSKNKNAYDVAIIGGGPGGYVAAIRAAQLGGKVALIEKESMGGVCLNTGCIPTKTLLRASEILKLSRNASAYGIFFDQPRIDYGNLMNYKENTIKKLQKGIIHLLKKNKVESIQGIGIVISPTQIEIQQEENIFSIEAKNIIIATGSQPIIPNISGLRDIGPMTSNEALTREELPKSIAIIGAGAIGCEFAGIYAPFGVKVTLIESADQILPEADQDVAKCLSESLKKEGVRILVSSQVTHTKKENTKKILTVETDKGIEEILVDDILIATGRKPNIEGLLKFEVRMEGKNIWVDKQMRTSIPSLYAVGDVTGMEYLAHVASAQGMVAGENCMENPSAMDYRTVSRCIYTSPEIASVGLSEKQAKDQNYDFDIGKYYFESNGRALTYGETTGFVKVLREKKYGQILGVHIIGPNASELIGEAVMSIHLETTTEEFALAIHPHPTLSEAFFEAILSSMGRGIHS
ncbi:dihydrolipoyl dehydrogenase [Jeotgalibacillus soli]|uniref:Dihydrolipoyl dehydrogenase n=1 Tax=Jeotgalibacillus soli TaxID=889306 RepID=A0A0C2RUI0_9BACL|nr:dihydrolipoyl dehydrogenase [Jeotgalibacillus soli]KIL45399.1 acetoin/pyruvate dehydrogenase complex, E3 component, dihydrolipoamide dehydrogenase [Jeotgalibacillus soli]